ncbi:BatA domain-containing protein [Lysobacter sp. LF1]|uniref:BatA domain-containing protein n=1 Tax=Lysobacter stagni TaxID=3045172 RepID=A0ABT6XBZ9_9GAMM|nr:BatA domain-containing protein [Lysobacter sp. LF1]MDI9237667.1 BatA domain-containing protein [Lysobacter sp. LF1]
MSLAFLIPAALAALAALLLPLLIHLARRSEQRPTEFAALRWLRQKPKPRHRIRFDEWPLLLVRLLLLVLFALLLARPVLFGSQSHAPYVAVAPGADASQARAALKVANARWHWLAPGFPELTAQAPASTASVSSLLRELDASLPIDVPVTVFVPSQLDSMDAQRIMLARKVDWHVLPSRAANVSPAPVAAVSAPIVRHAPEREASPRYLRAAFVAWRPADAPATAFDIAPHTTPLPHDARQLVWLVPGDVPAAVRDWIREGGVALIDTQARLPDAPAMAPLWRNDIGVALVEGAAYGRGRVMRLRGAMVPEAMPELLDPGFPQHLRALFAPPSTAPARVASATHAPVTGSAVYAPPPRDLQPWLILLIVLVFAVERWLATASRRAVAP